jgi:hypothetical protein
VKLHAMCHVICVSATPPVRVPMDAQLPEPPGASPPDVTFCVRSDLCSPPADHVLRCVWHPDCSVDIELADSQTVWRKQGACLTACPLRAKRLRLTGSFSCFALSLGSPLPPGVRRPDVQPISDAEWLRRAREVLGEGRHTCEVVHTQDAPKVSSPRPCAPTLQQLTPVHVRVSGCHLEHS